MRTTLDEMFAFVTIADVGSLTRAAEKLHLPNSVMSRLLRRLEQKLDTTLIRRTTRSLELTEEGQVFLEHARSILAAVDFAEEQTVSHRKQLAGRLRVNAATPFMQHVLTPLIPQFHVSYPDIELELNTSDEVIDLIEHRTDVAIRIGALRDSTLNARVLANSRLRILASPEYLDRAGRPVRPADLEKHTLLGYSQLDTLNNWPLRHAGYDVYKVRPAVRASSGETLLALAENGTGIACLGDYMTTVARRRGRLVEVLVDDTVESYRPIHAVYYRNTRLSARIAVFLDFVAEHFKDAVETAQGRLPSRRLQTALK
ncbi:LysR substrate-binding domain-containing protein [Paraburkholderia terrae]|uniref:LysR substrate-binding domain-containing protein n=1 Tax=Paraburkholderia terrae TaxID=311230 RepID=UPI001EE2417F|nr:LysR substrate-binding domain-containing protein [Paraburkholderia terrae]GJH01489.1 LysR family transcriptional regulator [Paraburkholderia terrae]